MKLPEPGTNVEIITRNRTYSGVLMERPELSGDKFLVIKLDNGYNIGIDIKKIREIRTIGKVKREEFKPKEHKRDKNKRNVSIM
ncbi:MAG TPA: Glu-tRNA(Gln) amidotransferase GatDE subunit D, partial [Candidatus Altiarchaeales archaeon]|nr:Glu-tRNA(Gln) amidotransferase GatDE subunit D [Candidatus Altiarchaeales archaeon]